MTNQDKASDMPLPGGNFRLFVQKLGYQALISLGVLENPITQSKSINLAQAQTHIDDLTMLRDKTKGNLEADEEEHLSGVIGELQRQYVQQSQAATTS